MKGLGRDIGADDFGKGDHRAPCSFVAFAQRFVGGPSKTTLVPSAHRVGYFPRIPPLKSYSVRMTGSRRIDRAFFFISPY